jgi:hypothetical protein
MSGSNKIFDMFASILLPFCLQFYNEKRRSILFHIWQPINSCIAQNQDCQHTYLIIYAMWCKLEGMFGQIPHQPTHPYILTSA